jgi:hypothetical protein
MLTDCGLSGQHEQALLCRICRSEGFSSASICAMCQGCTCLLSVGSHPQKIVQADQR